MSKTNPVIDLRPTKSFFVNMLTKDIEVEDSILDLIDNCVDGAIRSTPDNPDRRYEGKYAKISITETSFEIADNCGGIPHELAIKHAFRMGRVDDDARDATLATVGVYGIGMKRAIFKIGRRALVKSQPKEGAFEVSFEPRWLSSDDDWNLPMVPALPFLEEDGTVITINELNPGIDRLFGTATDFRGGLERAISEHFGYIIEKGFTIELNGTPVRPKKVAFLVDPNAFDKSGMAPYLVDGTYGGVGVFLSVGLYSDIPDDEALESAEAGTLGSPTSERAGWTIVCNDRVVLYADKTMKTGWGEAGVPRYHTQFVAISGIVVFKSKDPRLLPVGTTKRTIEGNSELYLSVKNYMREGLKLFTNYTNEWKTMTTEEKTQRTAATPINPDKVPEMIPEAKWKSAPRDIEGRVFKPQLPSPKNASTMRVIRFAREDEEIKEIGSFLLDNPDAKASEVGAACFDRVLAESRE